MSSHKVQEKKTMDIRYAKKRRVNEHTAKSNGNETISHSEKKKTKNNKDKRITLGNCKEVNNTFEKVCRIGSGTYGMVYKAKDRRDGTIVALKRVTLHHESTDGFPLTSLREISILNRLRDGPGIVRLHEVVVSTRRSGVYLVLEYCEHDLSQLLDYALHERRVLFNESQVKQLSMQLLKALEFLHERHVVHRDIKLSNILYNHRGRLKLADFGLARTISACSFEKESDSIYLTPKVVSLWYRAPELLYGTRIYEFGVDCWAAGCAIAELLIGKPFIKGASEIDQLHQIERMLGQIPAHLRERWSGDKNSESVKRSDNFQSWVKGPTIRFADCFRISTTGIKFLHGFFRFDCRNRTTAVEGLKDEYFIEHPLPTSPSLMPTFRSFHKK